MGRSMDKETEQLIQSIHDSATQVVIAVAGAGTTALADLLLVGGASRTLLEAIVPYSMAAFDEFLQKNRQNATLPKQYVSAQAARLLAGQALQRAHKLVGAAPQDARPLVGLACTAALATERVKRGDHRGHIAIWTAGKLIEQTLVLAKGTRSRAAEERLYGRLLLNALAAACGVDHSLHLALSGEEEVFTSCYDHARAAQELSENVIDFFAVHDHGEIRTRPAHDDQAVHPQTLLSGSFNPLHVGHTGMAAAAAKWLGQPVAFELSVANVDKPSLPVATVANRIAQFAAQYPIYVSGAATYQEKARLYPNATFVVGFDTAQRLFFPKYYGGSNERMVAAIAEIMEQGCRFLVAGRVDGGGKFRTIGEIAIPPEFRGIFEPIPESDFRLDISSTELRE